MDATVPGPALLLQPWWRSGDDLGTRAPQGDLCLRAAGLDLFVSLQLGQNAPKCKAYMSSAEMQYSSQLQEVF